MLCKIADLIVEVPEAGGLAPRCEGYLCAQSEKPDVVIRVEHYRSQLYPQVVPYDMVAYLESSWQFYAKLLTFDGVYLHASAVCVDGRAYLFSGPCGMGKSTHTRLWQSIFGEKAQVFNDDKPALRCIDGVWYAYGTPWCGKDGININMKAKLAGICFLKQSSENKIRRMPEAEAGMSIISQTIRYFKNTEKMDMMLSHVNNLVHKIPVFELENRPEPDAARLSYETMHQAAEELKL